MKNSGAKTGIITVHKNINYGANLQAYATSKFLNDKGVPTCVVDYLPKEQDKENHILSIVGLILKNEPDKSVKRILKLCVGIIMLLPNKIKRLHKFKVFRKKNMNLTDYCATKSAVENLKLDTVICGSDQIWNADITQGINPVYYGDISGVTRKISYAASVGGYRYPDTEMNVAKKWLNGLDYCSVREEDTQEYIKTLRSGAVENVCDPVFLLDKAVYKELAGKRIIKDKYLLVYSIVSNGEMLEKAEAYAKMYNYKLVEICANKKRHIKHMCFTDLGPEEFLNFFCYADVIFTNSFHGTAFSLIFEKEFYIFDNKAGGSRITNLLSKAGLAEREIDIDTDVSMLGNHINYELVYANLNEYIEKSKKFLLGAVHSNERELAGENCVGCNACEKICPVGAIRMRENAEGFFSAFVCEEKCITCGLCEIVCPAIRQLDDAKEQVGVYAFKAEDLLREKSTSGGAFSALADYILSKNGTVYGACMNHDFSVTHSCAQNMQELDKIRGVKYVQSDISDCFKFVESDLRDGKAVLFTGTPCQVSAVKEYMKVKKVSCDGLYLADIICHGIPTAKIFNEYIKFLGQKYKSKVIGYKFRDKSISWRGHSSSVVLEDTDKNVASAYVNAYMNVYYSGCITRKSCYDCRYTSTKRVSDITISDYWGIENSVPEFEDKLGVSMLLVNTDKGKELLDGMGGEKIKTVLTGCKQPQLYAPCEKPQYRELFWQEYSKYGINHIMKKYGGISQCNIFVKLLSKTKKILHKILNRS